MRHYYWIQSKRVLGRAEPKIAEVARKVSILHLQSAWALSVKGTCYRIAKILCHQHHCTEPWHRTVCLDAMRIRGSLNNLATLNSTQPTGYEQHKTPSEHCQFPMPFYWVSWEYLLGLQITKLNTRFNILLTLYRFEKNKLMLTELSLPFSISLSYLAFRQREVANLLWPWGTKVLNPWNSSNEKVS